MTSSPPPGSYEATEMGCTCPVIDNHHGAGRPDGTFIRVDDCPLHGFEHDE